MQQAMQGCSCSRVDSPMSMAGCASPESSSWLAICFISNVSIIKAGTQLHLLRFLLLHITALHCCSFCFVSGKYFILVNICCIIYILKHNFSENYLRDCSCWRIVVFPVTITWFLLLRAITWFFYLISVC